jgi:hypothetical protein
VEDVNGNGNGNGNGHLENGDINGDSPAGASGEPGEIE